MKSIYCVIAMMLVANVICALTVTYPNGGEVLVKGDTYEISWYGGGSGNVAIKLIGEDEEIDISRGTPNNGSYSWKVPVDLPLSDSKIRITHLSDSSAWDESDDYFRFSSPIIKVTSPKSGDELSGGSEYTITWTSNCYEGQVFIYLQGLTNAVIDPVVPNSGSYRWKVPHPDGVKQDSCRIGIYFNNKEGANEANYSGYFTIVPDFYKREKPKPPSPGKKMRGFVYVPAGSFIMGNTRDKGDPDERPTHKVTLNSFYIGKYEVTQKEYSKYMKPGLNWSSQKGHGDNYPAYYVSWYAVLKYCNLRSIAEKLTPCYTIAGSTNPKDWGSVPTSKNAIWDDVICDFSANGYRLPTEAEWEYAARGATNDPDYLYSGSDDVRAVAWYDLNSGDSSNPVGSKVANGLQIHDMSGNVWEWCWDWYGIYSDSPQDNPTGPEAGDGRLLRGGGWYNSYDYSRVSNRFSCDPGNGVNYYGFRLCRTTK